MNPLRVLDLYAGLGGWSAAFRDRGHRVLTLDNDPSFGCDVTADILTWAPPRTRFDVILASPPCEKFSTLSFMNGYFKMTGLKPNATYLAQRPEGQHAMRLISHTVGLVAGLAPRFYVMENPRALLRQLDLVPWERRTVWYCHVGHPLAKPTDLWGAFPPSLVLPGPCHNARPDHAADCCCRDHIAAPRGSRTGTQGTGAIAPWRDGGGNVKLEHDRNRAGNLGHHKAAMRAHYGTSSEPKLRALRGVIPYALSELVCLAAERDR